MDKCAVCNEVIVSSENVTFNNTFNDRKICGRECTMVAMKNGFDVGKPCPVCGTTIETAFSIAINDMNYELCSSGCTMGIFKVVAKVATPARNRAKDRDRAFTNFTNEERNRPATTMTNRERNNPARRTTRPVRTRRTTRPARTTTITRKSKCIGLLFGGNPFSEWKSGVDLTIGTYMSGDVEINLIKITEHSVLTIESGKFNDETCEVGMGEDRELYLIKGDKSIVKKTGIFVPRSINFQQI